MFFWSIQPLKPKLHQQIVLSSTFMPTGANFQPKPRRTLMPWLESFLPSEQLQLIAVCIRLWAHILAFSPFRWSCYSITERRLQNSTTPRSPWISLQSLFSIIQVRIKTKLALCFYCYTVLKTSWFHLQIKSMMRNCWMSHRKTFKDQFHRRLHRRGTSGCFLRGSS